MTDILDELLDEQNYEKKLRYFKKYLPVIAVFTFIGAILIFIYNWRENKTQTANMNSSAAIVKAISNNTAQDLGGLIESNNRLSELAGLEQVNIQIAAGDIDGAKAGLEKIINHKNYNKLTVNYAKIIWISMMIDQEDMGQENKALLEQYLFSFNNENDPLFGIGALFKALWYVKSQQKDLAIETLRSIITAKSASNTTKEQAKALLSNLSY
jgi:hypothetical protein